MTQFRVWAPTPESVAVEVGGERVPMAAADRGWRVAEVDWAGPGDDYRFVVDGDPLPDPRSTFQPEGVHGPSRVVDHAAFPWTDHGWRGLHLPSAVLYELHVGTFTPEGTFEAVVPKLDHIVELGVGAIELLPVGEFSGSRGWGYDGVDLYAPHHAYGGPDGLKKLVDACHHRGLAVVMDVVYNHLGPSGNYLSRFGPYFTDRYNTPWGDALNFDGADSDEVRRFFIDNALMWLRDYHIDGLRLDAVHAIVDTSATHLLEQLAGEVEVLSAHVGRPLTLIAESDLNDPRVVARREAGGYGMDAQWSDDFHHALHAALTGEKSGYYEDFGGLAHVATAMRQAFVYAGDYSPHRKRVHGRKPVGIAGHRFLGYLQNHDQVGNRAVGERSSHLMSTGRLKVGAALVLLSPFVPMLFQGEEWGASSPFQYFTDHEDAELGRLVSEGRRREFASFGWQPEDVPDPQAFETFERSRLDWDEVGREPHASLLAWHRALIDLRRSVPSLTDGRFDSVAVNCDDGVGRLVVVRPPVTVACNLGPTELRLPADGRLVLASEEGVRLDGDTMVLPPDSVAVVLAG
ncbi:MAG: maltooligosyltrehalose trehalohydrolase [Acidimicrobiaceae bacterium]|nr:maltooligosyltrehalose trehalohydrolase [Acidimicrobiaceae bacterium]